MWIAESIIYIFAALCTAALCIIVTANEWTRIRRIYFVLLLLAFVYIVAQFATIATGEQYALTVLRTGALSVNILSLVALLFCLEFTGHTLSKARLAFLTAPIGIFAVLNYSPLLIRSVTVTPGGFSTDVGGLYVVQSLVVATYFLASITVLALGLKNARGSLRSNTQLLIVGFSIPVVVNFVTNVILVKNPAAQILVPLSILALSAATGYAIIRHQLFDIRLFVLRASAYLTTLFVVTFLLVTPVVLAFGHFLDFTPTLPEFMLVVLSSVCALYILQYLRKLFDKLTTKIFFRHYYDPQDVQDMLSDILVRTADIDVLRKETVAVISDALKPSSLRYVLFADHAEEGRGLAQKIFAYSSPQTPNVIAADDEESDKRMSTLLRNENIALAVKLRTSHEDLGYMILGHKQSGETYTVRDRRLVSVAADEIAISLQNALRFEEIQSFNATLQEKVTKATGQLRRTNHRLRELDSTKDDFISMASHQLRTPLTSVKGYLSMVLEGDAGPLNDNQRKLLEQSYRSSQQMVYLISDLLNLSRLNTGKFVIEPTPVDLSELVQFEVSQLGETAKSRNINLVYERPANFPSLMLDETKIHQVVMNFIDNAIYYTPSGGTVTVGLRETPSYVEYTVKDTGIGVPKEAQRKLFTKFFRADNAQKARPDGTGLGLFMAKKVVAAQGGALIFESEVGKGSIFGFRFNKAQHLAQGQGKTGVQQ